MQLVFQFPIIDLRQVMQAGATVNVWPTPDMTKDELDTLMAKAPFIRNFGKIDSSPDGYFCNINCVKYPALHDKGFPINDYIQPVFKPYKRLFANSAYTITAEFGFTDQTETVVATNTPAQPVHMADILTHYLSIPVNIQDLAATGTENPYSSWQPMLLGEIDTLLAANYGRATAKTKDDPVADEYVVNGEGCITYVFSSNENILLPANAEKLDEFEVEGGYVQLFGYKLNFANRIYKVWLFQVPQLHWLQVPAIQQQLQNRRANLFRLNAEKETTRVLLRNLSPENTDAKAAHYITKTPQKIFKKERFSSPQDKVRDFALQSTGEFATKEDIKQILNDFVVANLSKMQEGAKAAPPRKKILFITSNPTDSNPVDFGEQFKKISEALQSGSDRDYFTLLNIESGVERDKVMEILYKNDPDFLHITLHASEINGLYFQDSAKNPDPMSAEEFADYVKNLKKQDKMPEAVILCACNSLPHANAVKEYCRYAVGTSYVFPDDAAIVYARKFYTALFNGKDVGFCHNMAVQGIKYNKPPFDAIDDKQVYDIPQLIVAK